MAAFSIDPEELTALHDEGEAEEVLRNVEEVVVGGNEEHAQELKQEQMLKQKGLA